MITTGFSQYRAVLACTATLLAPALAAQPCNEFFCGVEDRIEEAKAIVVGEAAIVRVEGKLGDEGTRAFARVRVGEVLRGDNTLRELEFATPYAPHGYYFSKGREYWGSEDEDHARYVETAPDAYGRPAIFFLKLGTNSEWRVFYMYAEGSVRVNREVILTIMAAQSRLQHEASGFVLLPLLARK